MMLKEWIKERGMTVSTFAQEIGLNPAYASRILSADQNPSSYMTDRIIAYTNGALKKEDICLYVKPCIHCPTCGKKMDPRKKIKTDKKDKKSAAPVEKAVAEKDEV